MKFSFSMGLVRSPLQVVTVLALALLTLTLLTIKNTAQASDEAINDQVKAKPTIIALAPHIVEMLFDIGAGKQIIATSDHANYPEAAKSIPSIGNSIRIQIERVIELQPDIIIAWKSGNPSDDLARLKQLGFKIVYSQPDTFADVAKELRHFGQLTGHKQRSEQIAQQFLRDLNNITQQYADRKLVNAFYEIWSRPLTTIAKGSWPQQFLQICGAYNPFFEVDVQYPQINIEEILQSKVELIIQPLSENQTDKEGYDWQKWSILPAVKHQQIVQPDADIMHRMTIRSLTALAQLCQDIDQTRQYYQGLAKQ